MNSPQSGDSTADPARWGELARERIPFVPRGIAHGSARATPIVSPVGERLPSLRDRSVWILLAFVALLQAIAWLRTDGYQIADSVEFMERARILVRGEEMIDAGAIRPLGFSAALLPFFAVADWVGLQDSRPIVWSICLLQNLLGLALVLVAARLGARLVDRRTGIVAGLLVGSNPVFLQYSTQPISGIAAAVCIGMAIESLLERGNFRRSAIAGLWLGAAIMMAYQSIAIVLVFAAIVLVRDRLRAPLTLSGLAAGASVGLFVQVLLDKIGYGQFGASLWNYLAQNFFGVLTSMAMRVGWTSAGYVFYNALQESLGSGYTLAEDLTLRGRQSPWFYIENLPGMLVWPVIGLLVLGVLRSVLRPNWKTTFLLVAFVVNVAILSNKGSKEFRLWLPLLPMIAPLCAYGGAPLWGSFDAAQRARSSVLQKLSTAVVLGTSLYMSFDALLALKTRQFGGYWKAIDWVNAHAREDNGKRVAAVGGLPIRLRVGSAYNWAVYMRESPLVELVKLPWQLNLWQSYDPAQRAADLATIEELDAFIVHLPMLTGNIDLFEWINAHFQVEAAFYDQEHYEDGLGPIFVLSRRSGSRPRTFFEMSAPQSAEEFRARRQLADEAHFVRIDETKQRLVLLGFEYEELEPEGLGWITYHWTTPTGLARDYQLIDRLTSPDQESSWQNNHYPGYGALPTSSWKPGAIFSEGFLVVPASEPYKPASPFRPIGGPYRRGDLIPITLWFAVIENDPVELERGLLVQRSQLHPARPGQDTPILRRSQSELVTPDGYEFSDDRLIKVGQFFLPVHPAARLPVEGPAVPNEKPPVPQ